MRARTASVMEMVREKNSNYAHCIQGRRKRSEKIALYIGQDLASTWLGGGAGGGGPTKFTHTRVNTAAVAFYLQTRCLSARTTRPPPPRMRDRQTE